MRRSVYLLAVWLFSGVAIFSLTGSLFAATAHSARAVNPTAHFATAGTVSADSSQAERLAADDNLSGLGPAKQRPGWLSEVSSATVSNRSDRNRQSTSFRNGGVPALTTSSQGLDDFSGYTAGISPTGWLMRGAVAMADPVIEEVGGTGPAHRLLSFPEVSWQYWDKWLLKGNPILSSSYTVSVKVNFQNSVADRAGLTIGWNDANWNRIDIQPNVYWDDVEFRVSYAGPITPTVIVTNVGYLPIDAYTDYWLRAVVADHGPGLGTVVVYWSADNVVYQPIVTATGLAEVTGWAGVGTAGPHLPHTHFDDFLVSTTASPAITYTAAGSVLDTDSNALAGALIASSLGVTTTTDSNGNYVLSALIAGSYVLTPSKTGYAFTPYSRTVIVPPSLTGQNFTGRVVPAAPTLSSPPNGASLPQSTSVLLAWNTAANADQYEVELWGGPYSLMTPCNWQVSVGCFIGQMWPGVMYWHVKARNATSDESNWSATQTFTIQDFPASVPMSKLSLSGAPTGTVSTVYTFTASIEPISATTPITYLWQVTGQNPITHVGGLNDTLAYQWSSPGVKAITLVAMSAGGAISTGLSIDIAPPPSGDPFEPDNTCAQAQLIQADGTAQDHTFHQQADQDWIKFNGVASTTYRIDVQIPMSSSADVALELFKVCSGVPEHSQDYAFSPGIRLEFTAPATGPVFLRLVNHLPTVYGSAAAYILSVRALGATPSLGAVVIVAGRLTEYDPLQSNIHQVTNAIYKLFVTRGYTDSRIYYLATDLGLLGVDALATADNLQAAVTTWALDKVGPNQPFTLLMVDHGAYDRLYLDKPSTEWVTPNQLDNWLTQLETARPGVKINVIVEACNSGSFIDLPKSISKPGRVVVASTGADDLAWASTTGAFFSDLFLDALREGASLYSSFQTARWAVQSAQPFQRPWLDDNGNGIPNEPTDGLEAQQRGFNFAGTFADDDWPPYIVQASGPITISQRRGVITAKVLDDQQVQLVWAVIFPPSYQPPVPGEELVSDPLPTIVLLNQGNGSYATTYTGFDEVGLYRVVVYAEDDQGVQARPVSIEVRTGWKVYLPIAMKP